MGFSLLAELNSSFICLGLQAFLFLYASPTPPTQSGQIIKQNTTGTYKNPTRIVVYSRKIEYSKRPPFYLTQCHRVGSIAEKASFILLESSRFPRLNQSQITMNGLSFKFSIENFYKSYKLPPACLAVTYLSVLQLHYLHVVFVARFTHADA